jgi:predicted NBD/HSP70 family sugar kinase
VGEYYALDHRPEDMVLLKMGMGIGGGVIARGRILRGAQGAAGDLGHLPQRGGARCRCGQEGCAEATAGGWVIAETLRRNGFPQVHTSHDIVRLARSGEALVHELLRQAGRRLGEMLVEVIGVLNPSTIIVGGNLAPASEDLLFSLRERVRELSHPLAVRDLRIVLGSLGPDAGILGASRLAAETAFDGPVIAGLIAHT